MFKQTIVGNPMQCLNRNCKANFYRESHLGYIPLEPKVAISLMMCPKCKDVFKVQQHYSHIHEYINKLPRDPKKVAKRNPITQKEVDNLSKKMSDSNFNPLNSLYEGLVPGASDLPED